MAFITWRSLCKLSSGNANEDAASSAAQGTPTGTQLVPQPTSEGDQCFLYLVSDVVDQKGITEAYKAVYKAMKRLPKLGIGPFEVKLVGPGDPVAKAVIALVSGQHAPMPMRVRGASLGDAYIENAFIYYI